MVKNQRAIALDILNDFYKKPQDLNELISPKLTGLDRQASGFINTLVYGTVRYSIGLDYYIRKLSKERFSRIDKDLVNILRMSLYQIIYMDHIAGPIAVNEGVNLGKLKKGKTGASFVNGVLRAFLRSQDQLMNLSNLHYKDYLRVKYSFPPWLIEAFLKLYGDRVEDVLDSYNQEADFDIRTNCCKISRQGLKESLQSQSYQVLDLETDQGLRILNPLGIFQSQDFILGHFYVQSQSSQFVGQVADLKANDMVLDLCAAPGGKSSHIYEKSQGQVDLVACDISSDKLDLVRENFKRLGHKGLRTCQVDATDFNPDFVCKFDLVLVDAPCSALGLLRRYPEMKHTKAKEDISSLAQVQYQILANAKSYVKKSGRLIYSTCTFTRQENEDQIQRLIDENPNFTLEEDIIRLSPHLGHGDGFTIGVLKNNGKVK